jgi:diaminohydroxyphosphoribosylaminopyrimidine deaminase/5-amino-6-(5-phosphoribosylamino)uracil reductase
MDARGENFSQAEEEFMRRALTLAERGYGGTSPNPMVGAVIVREGEIIGEGWHKRAGQPHAEVNAIAAAWRRAKSFQSAAMFVTLEPCCTFGRTPPCTTAIIESGIKEVIVAAKDPNPKHSGAGLAILRKAGIRVRAGLLAGEANRLNEVFNYWITRNRPFVICKCAMSLDGKIATNSGDSKWITSEKSRNIGMRLRLGADAVVAGVNTIARDDPGLTLRAAPGVKIPAWKQLKRIVLDPEGRIPMTARVLDDEHAALTTIIVTSRAAAEKIRALEKLARVMVAPMFAKTSQINLRWLLRTLGREDVTSLLVEGGGETHFNFLSQSLVNRVHFFYAPLVITGRAAPKAVGGERTLARGKGVRLTQVEWSQASPDWHCTALVAGKR